MRRSVLVLGGALALLANILQVLSWPWRSSRTWIDTHGLLISAVGAAGIATILIVASARIRIPNPLAPTSLLDPNFLRSYEPVFMKVGENTVEFAVHFGPMETLDGVEVLVSSENTYLQMSQTFKPSISGRIRFAAATKDELGRVVDDVAQEQLNEWMRSRKLRGGRVAAGTVVPTTSGELARKGVKMIAHAAVVEPEDGTGNYHTNSRAIRMAAESVFDLMCGVQRQPGHEQKVYRSVCFPLLGAGRGGVTASSSLHAIFDPVVRKIAQADGNADVWRIHFVSWRKEDVDLMRKFLKRNCKGGDLSAVETTHHSAR